MAPGSAGSRVGEHVRALRTERGWSMRELATLLGVSAATVSAIEHGHTGISVQRLNDLARTFGVSETVLLSGSPETSGSRRPSRSPDRDPVLDAAVGAFVAAGYHGSSMRTIAERADMSMAGVYHHYPSKQALLVAILDLAMDDLDRRFATAGQGVTDPLERLYRLVETLALFHTEQADLGYIGASEMRSLEEPDRTRIAERRSRIQHQLDHEIRRAIRDGSAECPRMAETGRAISTMCTSLPQWFDPSGPATPDEIAKAYAELALRMIGTRPQYLERFTAKARVRRRG